jgi:DNA repair exonuclease SbcCD nuclease subunit
LKPINFVTFTDLHISDTPPTARTDDYLAAILSKLEQVKLIAQKLECSAVLCAGDVFHLKSPWKVSHSLTQIVIKVFKNFPCPIVILAGNHDLSANRVDSLPKQPLGTIFESGAAHNVLESDFYAKDGDTNVLVRGVPYSEAISLADLPKSNSGEFEILLLHWFASEAGGDFFGSKMFSYKELGESSSADVFVIGHDHRDGGISTLNISGRPRHFINVGALSRGSLDEDNLKRDVKVGIISVTGEDCVIRQVKLKVQPVSKIFDLAAREKKSQDKTVVENFISQLTTPISVDSPDLINSTISAMNLSKEIHSRIYYYLEQAQ